MRNCSQIFLATIRALPVNTSEWYEVLIFYDIYIFYDILVIIFFYLIEHLRNLARDNIFSNMY